MAKLIACLSLMVLAFIISLWSMIAGWGLTAKSWPVIITALIANMVVMVALDLVQKSD